jgi:hypothetical protein
MTAVIRGPYCTGASIPAGAWPHVRAPQAHRRSMSWCSLTRTEIGGISNSCRRVIPTCGAPARSDPQPRHTPGSCTTTSSGTATGASVEPGCPCWPPGLRPLRPRNERGAGLASPSDEGGLEEFFEFCASRASSSATRWASRAFSVPSCSISRPWATTSAINSSREGPSTSDTHQQDHTHRPNSRTDTHKISD